MQVIAPHQQMLLEGAQCPQHTGFLASARVDLIDLLPGQRGVIFLRQGDERLMTHAAEQVAVQFHFRQLREQGLMRRRQRRRIGRIRHESRRAQCGLTTVQK